MTAGLVQTIEWGLVGAAALILFHLLFGIHKELVLINQRLREVAWRLAREQGETHWLGEHE